MDYEQNKMTVRAAKTRIVIIGLAIMLIFILTSGFLADQYMSKSEEQRLNYLKQTVELARNALEPILVEYRSQKLTKAQAINQIRDLVRRMVYQDKAGDNYIFMSSYDGTMLVQPFEPGKEMTNMWNLQDSYGVYIIRSLVETAQSKPGSGYVTYHYQRPGQTKPEEKISFVIGIPELSCYIGTGKYMSDIRSAQQLYFISLVTLTFIMLLLLSILVFSSMKALQKQNIMLLDENAALKQAEETVRKSESRFRKLFNVAAIPLCLVDDQGIILDFNNKFHQTFGYEREDIPTLEDWRMRAYPDHEYRKWVAESVDSAKDKARKGMVDFKPIEYKVTCKNGEVKNVIISGTTFEEYFLATLVDITERKQAEKLLRSSEEKYRLLVDNAEESIYVAQSGRLVFANPKTERIIGYSIDELMARPFTEFIYPDDRDIVLERHVKRLKGYKEPFNYNFRVQQKSGGVRWVDLKVVLIEWEGKPATLNFVSDITSQKEAEEEKLKIEAQLRQSQKMEAIGILAGGIAHDFNNLLQAINGYTQLLLLEKETTDPDILNLKGIQKASNRAANLVKQLLLFSRKAEIERKPINLDIEIEHVRKMLERTIPKMVDIRIHHGSRLWAVNADPIQIEQILLNMGVNAVDAMPDGGELIIETQNVTLDQEYAQEHLEAAAGNYVLLTVSDTGQGMDKETVEHIFEPFFTTKAFGKGTGLGLASVYGTVKSHGGHINCYSEIGLGTTFKIYFPALEQPATEEEKEFPPNPPGGTETILLVDDEKAIRGSARQALARFGYTVMTASTGEEALEIYSGKSGAIDLVIMDLGMPGMGGYKCLGELLQINPTVKVVIASGYSINGQVRKALEIGAAGYVGKPYQLSDLLYKVREALDKKS